MLRCKKYEMTVQEIIAEYMSRTKRAHAYLDRKNTERRTRQDKWTLAACICGILTIILACRWAY